MGKTLEERVEALEMNSIPTLLERQISKTEQELDKCEDWQVRDALHIRLQKYLELAIEFNRF